MGRPRLLFWVNFFLGLVLLMGMGSALAQVRVYVPRERLEPSAGKKPPAEVKPGQEGASKYGWGAIKKKAPAVKGSGSQGWKREEPQGHVDPSKARAGAINEPPKPKERQGPKQPRQSKASQGYGLEEADQPQAKKGLPSAPQQPPSMVSSFKMGDDDTEDMMEAPGKKNRTPFSRNSTLSLPLYRGEDEDAEDE